MPAPSPYDDPVPHGWRPVRATLRIAVAVMCWGLAAARLQGGAELEVLRLAVELDWLPEQTASSVADFAAYGLIACGLSILLRPCWFVLLPVLAWMVGRAAAPAIVDRAPIRALVEAVLVVTPLTLLLIDFWPPRLKFSLGRTQFALWLLRAGVVISLVARAALLIGEIGRGGPMSESLADLTERLAIPGFGAEETPRALAALAAGNVALSLVLLSSRQRTLAFATAVWSGLLAALPLVAVGETGWPATLIQAPAVGGPLALCFFWTLAVKEQAPTIVPAD